MCEWVVFGPWSIRRGFVEDWWRVHEDPKQLRTGCQEGCPRMEEASTIFRPLLALRFAKSWAPVTYLEGCGIIFTFCLRWCWICWICAFQMSEIILDLTFIRVVLKRAIFFSKWKNDFGNKRNNINEQQFPTYQTYNLYIFILAFLIFKRNINIQCEKILHDVLSCVTSATNSFHRIHTHFNRNISKVNFGGNV